MKKEDCSSVEETIILGIAGTVGGIVMTGLYFPFCRSPDPFEDGYRVFKVANAALTILVERGHRALKSKALL